MDLYSVLSPIHTSDKVEFNTVDFVSQSRLLPKPATKSTVAVYVQLCCRFWQQNRQQREFDSLSRSTLLPIIFMVDFVASVYGAKATRPTLWTFNKFDRVELNFVASLYRALDDKHLVLKALRYGSHRLTCKQLTPCLPLAFVRVRQMAPPWTVVTTSSCSLLLIYRPRKDKWLSWPS